MRRILLLFIVILSALLLFSGCEIIDSILGSNDQPQPQEVSNDFKFVLNKNKSGYILVGIDECTKTDIVIPSVYLGLPVVAIGDYAFQYNSSITSVTVPNSITSIGRDAFANCSSLQYNEYGDAYYIGNEENPYLVLVKAKDTAATSCEINGNTRFIHSNAFIGCHNLESIHIPSKTVSVGVRAFFGCKKLKSVTVEDGVTSIGEEAFRECESLKSITTPNGVAYIGDSAFRDCTKLTNATLGEGLAAINNFTFSGCKNLTSISVPDSVTSIGSGAFSGCGSLADINIPFGVTSIGASSFLNCSSLTCLVIPGSVTSIDVYAFVGCKSLVDITIPDSITSIGDFAFQNCDALANVYITDIVAWCNISFSTYTSSPLFYAKNLYLNGDLLTDLIIPDEVTGINNFAFYGCTSLTGVVIPDSVTYIGDQAFRDCTSLTSVAIGNGVNTIGDSVFCNCTGLTDIAIGNGVKTIDNLAFYNCTSLEGVYITDIAAWCEISSSHLYGSGTPLYYAKKLYLNGELVTDLIIPEGVSIISLDAFAYCSDLVSVTIPKSVTSIYMGAFSYCTNLASINYQGTEEEWNQIIKGSYWDHGSGEYTITYNYTGE